MEEVEGDILEAFELDEFMMDGILTGWSDSDNRLSLPCPEYKVGNAFSEFPEEIVCLDQEKIFVED